VHTLLLLLFLRLVLHPAGTVQLTNNIDCEKRRGEQHTSVGVVEAERRADKREGPSDWSLFCFGIANVVVCVKTLTIPLWEEEQVLPVRISEANPMNQPT